MAESTPAPPPVSGLSLAGSTPYTISAADNARVCKLVGVEPDADGNAHPIFFYIATQVGMGMSVAGLCAACEFDVEKGPLLASSKTEFPGPLRIGVPYDVRGEILSLTRKPSRKLGVIDLLEYQLRLHEAGGEVVLKTTHVWVLPRGMIA
ncbi:MAG TPA: hypothetical protein VHB68_03305 [Steroidobacteraceae bacterium]|nr:hypothetical protein [Steroidobacteraceae bacterium]